MSIESIAAGGDGVGRAGELVVFVPRTAPGDVVQIAYRQSGRLGRGRVLQRLTDAPDRVASPCAHYEADQCGGCQLQHLRMDAQRVARQQIVQDALQRIGRRQVPRPTITSDVEWGYRGRLTLTLQRRGRHWIGGLHPHDDATRVFALRTCPIAHPALVRQWHAFSALLSSQALPDVDTLRVAFRLERDEVGDGVAIVVQGGTTWPTAATFARALAQSALTEEDIALSAVWWMDARGTATRVWSRRDTLSVAPTVDEPAEDAPQADYVPAATEALAFAQINARVADALRAAVQQQVLAFSPERVVDAYAGAGVLTEQLAAAGVAVVAIEADAAGANAIIARLAAHDASVRRRARVVCELVERAMPAVDASHAPDVVVVNPPRRGVERRVTDWLERAPARVRGLVYVSCNPATLARDLARLSSWEIVSVECFDMFPQTAHVETVCVLRRRVDQAIPSGETA